MGAYSVGASARVDCDRGGWVRAWTRGVCGLVSVRACEAVRGRRMLVRVVRVVCVVPCRAVSCCVVGGAPGCEVRGGAHTVLTGGRSRWSQWATGSASCPRARLSYDPGPRVHRAFTRPIVRLRPRPALAPRLRPARGSTDYGPCGRPSRPDTCAPAHLRTWGLDGQGLLRPNCFFRRVRILLSIAMSKTCRIDDECR